MASVAWAVLWLVMGSVAMAGCSDDLEEHARLSFSGVGDGHAQS
ncbi:MAG: hypothetical protein QOC71_716, partial [Thermoplasmata archaeon]|nr:hypothetical protein [Thermoplasmata archaeon]